MGLQLWQKVQKPSWSSSGDSFQLVLNNASFTDGENPFRKAIEQCDFPLPEWKIGKTFEHPSLRPAGCKFCCQADADKSYQTSSGSGWKDTKYMGVEFQSWKA